MPKIKKEDIYYTLLKDLAQVIVDAGEEYVNIMSGYPATAARIPRMKMYETRCDEIVRNIMERLVTSFITPFDREDISELALAMDDVIDYMEGVTLRLDLFNVSSMRPEAIELASLALEATRALQQMVEHLPNHKRDDMVMRLSMTVGQIEDGADEVYENALRDLFREEDVEGREYLAWLRLYDRMESCLDACDKAATVARNVVLKSS